MLQSLMHIRTSSDGVISRRSFLRNVAVGAAGAGLLGWKDAMALHADELRQRGMACILLFMRGGPSQLETFDPKPGTDHGRDRSNWPPALRPRTRPETGPHAAAPLKTHQAPDAPHVCAHL